MIINYINSPKFSSAFDAPKIGFGPVLKGHSRDIDKGFNELVMYKNFKKSETAIKLEEMAYALGYSYGGHTHSQSKANTDHTTKCICINMNLSADVAALSFAYELSNAVQHEQFLQGPIWLYMNATKDILNAEKYASQVLQLEAKSVLARSIVAIEASLDHLVANQKYIEIAKNNNLSEEEKISDIYLEMQENAKVHSGTKLALEHYKDQFLGYVP